MYFYIKIDLDFTERVDKYSKAESVQFENMSAWYEQIINEFRSSDDLNIFRLSLYNYYKTKVKIQYIKKSEVVNGEVEEKLGFRLSSDLIRVDDHILAQCFPYYLRKKYFGFNQISRKYYSNANLIYQYSFN